MGKLNMTPDELAALHERQTRADAGNTLIAPIADPMDLKWKAIKFIGAEKVADNVCVCAKDHERDSWWVVLKDIPPRLANYIIKMHNDALFARTGWEDND